MDSWERESGSVPDVWVVLPTLDEAENLENMVRSLAEVRAAANGFDLSAVVVDDNSPDGTGSIASSLAGELPWLEVIHRPGRLGLGSAYIEGFEFALANGADACIQMDCDFSHDPDDIARLVACLKSDDVQLVIGSRYVDGGSTVNWNLWRRSISRFGSFYARSLLGTNVRDFTGGFKCFDAAVLRAIDLDQADCYGYAINVELTYRAIARGFSVSEIPITFVDRQAGKSKMSKSTLTEAAWKVPSLRFRRLPEVPVSEATAPAKLEALTPVSGMEETGPAREPA